VATTPSVLRALAAGRIHRVADSPAERLVEAKPRRERA
jgi:hypothetical protein